MFTKGSIRTFDVLLKSVQHKTNKLIVDHENVFKKQTDVLIRLHRVTHTNCDKEQVITVNTKANIFYIHVQLELEHNTIRTVRAISSVAYLRMQFCSIFVNKTV